MILAPNLAAAPNVATPTGAILAGGRALRFGGRAKGLELVGGMRIVDRVAAALREVANEVLLVGAAPSVSASLAGCRVVPDETPGDGPLGAIVTALRASGDDTLVVAWDMPFVSAAILRPLLVAPPGADAVVWRNDGHLEPLCALYRSSALDPLAAAFSGGERSPRSALERLDVHVLTRESSDMTSPFSSINTAEQLEAARRVGPGATR